MLASFLDAVHGVLDSDASPEAVAFVAATSALAAHPHLVAKLEMVLSRTRVEIPTQPAHGSLRRLWEDLRSFSMDATREAMVVRDHKPGTTHVMAEQFDLGHISLPNREGVRVFKRNVAAVAAVAAAGGGRGVAAADPHWDTDTRLYFDTIRRFLANDQLHTFNFPAYLTSEQREKVHFIAGMFPGIDHDTFGSKKSRDRFVRITKVDLQKRHRNSLVTLAQRGHRMTARELPAVYDTRGCVTAAPAAAAVRFVDFNVSWLDVALESDEPRCAQLAAVILELQPCVLCLQEGPSSAVKMQTFVDARLGGRYSVFGGFEELRQQIYILVLRDGAVRDAQLHEPALDYLSQPWQFDLNGDRVLLEYKFCRRPVVVRATLHGQPLVVCAVHMKSMKIANGEQLCRVDMDKFIERSIKNRRRIGAECHRVRQCLEDTVFAPSPPGCEPLVIVAGDLNTGPGRDFFEKFYLLFDVIDVIQGSPFDKTKRLFATLINSSLVQPAFRWSAVFRDCMDASEKHVLVDHIFVSAAAKRSVCGAGIAHDVFERHGSPSDHRPVYVDLLATMPQVALALQSSGSTTTTTMNPV